MVVIPSDYFNVESYKRYVKNGKLSKGVIVHCKGERDMKRIRSNVYQYARTREHLTYTEKQDSKNFLHTS
jgi:hypothetical protein